jgi:hypothetical protein
MAGCSSGAVGNAGNVGRFGLLISLVVATASAGCGGGGDLGPMSGRQLIEGRDVNDLFFWQARTLAFTRETSDSSQPEPQDFLVWPIDEPSPSMALAGIDWGYPRSWPVWFSGDLLVTGSAFERVYSIETRQSANTMTDFPAAGGGAPAEPSTRELLASVVLRSDGHALAKLRRGTPETIVVGRPPELREFSLPADLSVGGMTFVGADLALLTRRRPADPFAVSSVGINRLDTSSGALTPLVPETEAPEWTGITGFCESAMPPANCGFFGTIGCGVDEPACPDGHAPPCMLLYAKADPGSDMKISAYVQDAASGVSTRLAGDDISQLFSNRDHHVLVWGSRSTSVTHYWNVCGDTRGECPVPPGSLSSWRPDGGAFAMYGIGDVMNMVDVTNNACINPDANKTYSMYQVQWSPAGDRLMWVAANDADGTSETLWLGDRDAGSPVALSGGPSLAGTFSGDGQFIYVSHEGESTASLGWIDLTVSPPTEHVLASNRGPIGMLGNRRALFVDHYNAQDDNGELVLVDMATGERQSLARAVTGVTATGSEDAGVDVAYTVRGRAAASRDGLWLTTLPP